MVSVSVSTMWFQAHCQLSLEYLRAVSSTIICSGFHDLLVVSSSQKVLYAEDTKCLKQINDLEDYKALQQDLHNLALWSDYWHLPFNESKCILLRFTPRPVDLSFNQTYYIQNYPVAMYCNVQWSLGGNIMTMSWPKPIKPLASFIEHLPKLCQSIHTNISR